MRVFILVVLVLLVPMIALSASNGSPAVTITPQGGLALQDGTVVPPFPKAGRWTELPGKSSERYETRHFSFLVPGEAPALELYLAVDRQNDPPDGAFEIGMVQGFLSGFARKAGLQHQEPVFEQRRLGRATVMSSAVKLSDARRALWVYAYVYPRTPSLTFIAIRATDSGRERLETYLQSLYLH